MRSEIKVYEGRNDRIVGGGGCLLLSVLLPSLMSSDRLVLMLFSFSILLMLAWSKSIFVEEPLARTLSNEIQVEGLSKSCADQKMLLQCYCVGMAI